MKKEEYKAIRARFNKTKISQIVTGAVRDAENQHNGSINTKRLNSIAKRITGNLDAEFDKVLRLFTEAEE